MHLMMKSVLTRYAPIFLFIISLAIQGCTAAAVAYGVSKMTAPKTEPPQYSSRSPEVRTYPEYVTEMERINLEREKASLQPRPIMTHDEWVATQKAGTSAPTPAPPPPPAEPPGKATEAKE